MDPNYFRPTEVDILVGDPSRALEALGWESKVTFEELVRIMVDADAEALGADCKGEGRAAVAAKCGEWHCAQQNVTGGL